MIEYQELPLNQIEACKDLCNALMAFQKTKAKIKPELFDDMNFETRLIPSVKSSRDNYVVIVKDNDNTIGYVYANIAHKNTYSNDFATFFNLSSISGDYVGCLSQFYIDPNYQNTGIGSHLFNIAKEWLDSFSEIKDQFIFVSNGNDRALHFYLDKGFQISHDILEGFITVLKK